MAEGNKEKVQQDNRTRAQKARDLHEANTQRRADDLAALKVSYLKEADSAVLVDILAKANGFIRLHNKIAQDGVAVKKTGHQLTNGQDEVETVYLTNNQRASHLDKSAGLQELVDYIERMTTLPPPKNEPAKPATA